MRFRKRTFRRSGENNKLNTGRSRKKKTRLAQTFPIILGYRVCYKITPYFLLRSQINMKK